MDDVENIPAKDDKPSQNELNLLSRLFGSISDDIENSSSDSNCGAKETIYATMLFAFSCKSSI